MSDSSPFQFVVKRDGRIAPFDQNRITNAVYKAMQATKEGDLTRDPIRVSDWVAKELSRRYPKEHQPHIEQIQDAVEEVLITRDFPKTAKAYILYRQKRAELRDKKYIIPEKVKKLVQDSKKYFSNALAEFIFYRTYSRWIEQEGRRETWIESVERFMAFMKENLGSKLQDNEYARIREFVLRQKTMPSMRLMWSAGRACKVSNVSAYNCSFIAPAKLRDFAEIMYLLMCGTGVGFSVESQTAQQLPIISRQNGKKLPVHIIEDSKEGWGNALTLGLETWYKGHDINFDFSKIRPAGSKLHTMGGRASGPEPLRSLLDFSRERILARQGKRLRNIDVHDIICKIGECVVAGGVRRSALISLSDLDDPEMREAKSGQFWLNNPQRSMANNSAVYNEKPSAAEFMEEWLSLAKAGTGERGIFNRGGLKTQLPARRYKISGPYLQTMGTNPCITADTWIMTSDGARQISELINKHSLLIVNGKAYPSTGFFKTGNKEVFIIKTHRGFQFKATLDHKVLIESYRGRKIQRYAWKRIKDLKVGDKVILNNHSNLMWIGKGTLEEGWLLGSLVGDGNIEKYGKVNLDYWGATRFEMMERAVDLIHATVGGRSDLRGHIAKTGYTRTGSTRLGELAASYGITYNAKQPTDEVEKGSSAFYQGFLRGWFDADGSVRGHQLKGVSVRLNSSNALALERAQRMLARLGIIGTLYLNRRPEQERILPDGKGSKKVYKCKPNHELIITGSNLKVFSERIGFSDPAKQRKLNLLLSIYRRRLNRESFTAKIVEITPAGIKSVYDCVVPNVNAFDGNGFYLHNCGEIILRSKEFCNLTEVVARPEDTEQTLLEKIEVAAILGTYQSTLTNFSYLSKEWKRNCEEERLLGVSITGQWDCSALRNPEIFLKMRQRAVEVNKEYAKRFGINPSAAITTTKPSGTVSQLTDSASGMHPRHAPYYVRRVRISATDPLFQMMKDQKFPYHPEVGQSEGSAHTYVLEFPVKAPQGANFKDDLSALQQLEYWKLVKENFTEHNPSVTISVGSDEWIEVAQWLYKNWEILGGLSFLPRSDFVYQLAPYEPITKEEYEKRVKELPEIDFSQILIYEQEDTTQGSKEYACVGGVCEFTPEEPIPAAPAAKKNGNGNGS